MNVVDKIIELVVWPFRVLVLLLTFWTFWWGARRERKWVSKNDRLQDQNHNPIEKRWEYAYKKCNYLSMKLGMKIVVKGEDNLPKGACIITPNHISNADIFAVMKALGEEKISTAVAKQSLEKSKLRGYGEALEVFYVNKKNMRQSVAAMMGSAKWAKEKSNPVVVFPEGKRSGGNGKLLNFNDGIYAISKKLLLPIVPMTIVGTENVFKNMFLPGKTKVYVIIDKQIKPKDVRHKDASRITEDVKKIIQSNLDKYY